MNELNKLTILLCVYVFSCGVFVDSTLAENTSTKKDLEKAIKSSAKEIAKKPGYFGTLKDIKREYGINPKKIDYPGFYGLTALQVASGQGASEKVKLLLKLGANPNTLTNPLLPGMTLGGPSKNGQFKEIPVFKNMSPLQLAASFGDFESFKAIFEHGGKIDHKDPAGMTVLFYPCINGNMDIFNLILTKRPNINQQDSGLATPLYHALRWKHYNIAKKLIQLKADPTILTDGKTSPLHYAVARNQPDIVFSLLRLGADPFLKNSKGFSPIDVAKKKNLHKVLKVINDFKK